MKERVTRTEDSAIKELLDFYKENGKFNSTKLMKSNSGLERYLRVHHEGLRGFCVRNNIEYILTAPKKVRWTDELVSETIKNIYYKHKKPVGLSLLTSEGVAGLYQWITKNGCNYKDYCESRGLGEYINSQTNWSDAKCFRLIKDLYTEKKEKVTPELIKHEAKGAHSYIYENYEGFEHFINTFDLQDFVSYKIMNYDDELISRLLKESYHRKGEKVNAKWLRENGYDTVSRYLREKGNGSFIEGCKLLGLSEYAISAYTDWSDELVLSEVNDMLSEKGDILISQDFVKFGKTGMRDWVIGKYGDLQTFFETFDMSDKFANMAHIGKELWSYGIQFQKLAKEAVEIFFDGVMYDKWVEHLSIRPDFVIGDSGLWIDAKLSSFAYFTDETVEKYTSHELCKELWLLHLRGHKFKIDNPKVKVIPIQSWYDDLERLGYKELIDRIELLRDSVERAEVPKKSGASA